jgi:hypothetical protein
MQSNCAPFGAGSVANGALVLGADRTNNVANGLETAMRPVPQEDEETRSGVRSVAVAGRPAV